MEKKVIKEKIKELLKVIKEKIKELLKVIKENKVRSFLFSAIFTA